MDFTEQQRQRYARNLILEGVGAFGQEKLLKSKVLVIGAGGLGSPALMYLAASGVGTLGIADGDRVEVSNLQRQIIHGMTSLDVDKAESAARRIRDINPDVKTVLYRERMTAENILDIVAEYDFILDGVDNFAAKFLINDACVLAGKPFCHAGVLGYCGQIMTYVPGQGPCYRCVFEEIPSEGAVDSCATVGVLCTLPGILGSLQALEAQKYLLGCGELLTGRILTFDGRTMQFRQAEMREASKHCRVCGPQADITALREENYQV